MTIRNLSEHKSYRNFDSSSVESGDGGGHDDGMEHRVTALETRLDTLLPTLATKADIEGVRGDINRWMLATTLTIIGTVVAAIIGLNTIWKASPANAPAQQAPIVIQVPAYPAAVAPVGSPAPAKH